MDNLEWNDGFTPRFGLFSVDYEDPMRPRSIKYSGTYYSNLAANNGFSKEAPYLALNKKFPDNFIWATATASYQIEGGVFEGGREPSIWDQSCKTCKEFKGWWNGNEGCDAYVKNNDNGDVACDSYNNWETDVENLKKLGVNSYRFSISWSRVMKESGEENAEGIAYYTNLIDALVEADIEPMVTIFHWDLPNYLQVKYDGWKNETIIDRYVGYSRLCFEKWGSKVPRWITFNEPWVFTELGYGTGERQG